METFIEYDKNTKEIIGIQQSFDIPKNTKDTKYKKVPDNWFSSKIRKNKIYKLKNENSGEITEEPPIENNQ